jgi:hypothetical protein
MWGLPGCVSKFLHHRQHFGIKHIAGRRGNGHQHIVTFIKARLHFVKRLHLWVFRREENPEITAEIQIFGTKCHRKRQSKHPGQSPVRMPQRAS